jgi:diguanylate cyclase (GGDEF)-like protein/PAS domain S-box-containing protein
VNAASEGPTTPLDEATVTRLCRAIVETSPLVYYVVDAESRVIFANQASSDLLGYAPDEILGMAASDLIHPDDLDTALAALSQIVETGTGRPGQVPPMAMRVRHRNGETTYLEVGAVDQLDNPEVGGLIIRGRSMNGQQMLDQALEGLVASSPLEEVLTYLEAALAADLPGSKVVIAYDWDGERFASMVGDGPWPRPDPDAKPDDASLPWIQALTERQTVIRPDLDQLPPTLRAEVEAAGLRACWASPVSAADDDLLRACVVVWRDIQTPPWVSQRVSLDRATQLTALALARRHHENRLVHAALHDTLTGVPNRAKFFDHLERVAASGDRAAAVLYLDLDGFKLVNDREGHAVGDELLKIVTQRISANIRPDDLLARLGGDEFAIVCTDLAGPDEAEIVAQRLVAAVGEPATIDGRVVQVGLSIGVALAGRAGDAQTAARLVEDADAALYQAKQAGKGRYRVAP